MSKRALIALAVATLIAPCIANGKPPEKPPAASNYTVYTDKASFLAAVGELVFQGFEASPEFACPPYPNDYSGVGASFESASFAATIIPESGGTAFLCVGDDMTTAMTPRATEGTHFLSVGSVLGNDWTLDVSLLASRPVYAVGFYMVDAAEKGDAMFVGPDGTRITMLECCQPGGSTRFFGVVSNKTLTSFSLEGSPSDGWAIDEVMLGFGRPKGRR